MTSPGYSDIYIFHIDSERLQQVTDDTYDDRDPAWSPDGTRIAFSSDRTRFGIDGAYNLFAYDLRQGGLSYITYGDRIDFGPSWSPDGDWLVFSSTVPG